jgi:hypothetical protein
MPAYDQTTSAPKPSLEIRAEAFSPVDHDVELVAVGVVGAPAGRALQGAVLHVDTLLQGAVERLRGRAGAAPPGETELVAGAPGIKAPRVLLIWLGPAEALTLDVLHLAGRQAVSVALSLGVATLGMAPGLRDAGVTTLGVGDVSHAVAVGAREAFAAEATRGAEGRRSLELLLEASPANLGQALEGIGRA